jgi:hypothetical protein
MNAIDLKAWYKLLSVWRLRKNGQWELVDIVRLPAAQKLCRQGQQIFAFPPEYCPANLS